MKFPTTIILSFLAPVVVIHLVDWLVLVNAPDKSASPLAFAWSSISKASYLFCKGAWEGEGGQKSIEHFISWYKPNKLQSWNDSV